MQYEITIDLCADYSELVQNWMRCHGIHSDKSGAGLWYEFFNLQKKSVQRGCGHFPGLVTQPYQGSADTPKDSYFQVIF